MKISDSKITISKSEWEHIGRQAGWTGMGQHLVTDEVPCKYCGKSTRMTGTKKCDRCWEIERAIISNTESQCVQYGLYPTLAEKIRESLSKTKSINQQAGWGKSFDASASQLAELRHKITGLVFQLTRKHGWPMAEVIEGLKNHGYLTTNELNIGILDIGQAKLVAEGLEMFYKDMERLDKDFGAERENLAVEQGV